MADDSPFTFFDVDFAVQRYFLPFLSLLIHGIYLSYPDLFINAVHQFYVHTVHIVHFIVSMKGF